MNRLRSVLLAGAESPAFSRAVIYVLVGLIVAALAWFEWGGGRPVVVNESSFFARTSEKSVTQTKKKTTTARDTYRRETMTFLKVPDGGVLLVPLVESGSREREESEEQSRLEVEKHSETKSTTRTAPAQANWRVGLQVGASWSKLTPSIPGAGPLVFGATVDFRVPLENLAPQRPVDVWLGAWGGTYGAAGGSLTVSWPAP